MAHTLDLYCQPDLQKILADWRRYLVVERNLSRHTVRAYETDITQFLKFLNGHFGHEISLNDLSESAIRDFRAFLARRAADGATSASRARMLAGIRNFFSWMDRNGVLHNPAPHLMQSPKRPPKVPHPMDIPQIFMLMDESLSHVKDWVGLRDYALFSLLYGSGLRIDEALSLNVGDWVSAGKALRVMGKGQKEREVPLLPTVRQRIDLYRDAAPLSDDESSPLFCGSRGGRLNQGVAQRTMRDLRVTLGLPDTVTPHALRHSFATHLLGKDGLNMREIQHLLGHASLSSTQIYTDVDHRTLLETFQKAHPRA